MAVKKASKKKTTTSSSNFKSGKLVKSKSDKMVSGVMGGLGEYLQIDSTVLRLVAVAVTAFTGFIPGIVAYGLAMLVIPEK